MKSKSSSSCPVPGTVGVGAACLCSCAHVAERCLLEFVTGMIVFITLLENEIKIKNKIKKH